MNEIGLKVPSKHETKQSLKIALVADFHIVNDSSALKDAKALLKSWELYKSLRLIFSENSPRL